MFPLTVMMLFKMIALHHFYLKGTSCSLNKFIESLNMSKGQFYYYFKTKEELIFEVIDKKAQKIFDDTVKNVAKEKTFYNKLLSLFSFYLGNCSAEDKFPKVSGWKVT